MVTLRQAVKEIGINFLEFFAQTDGQTESDEYEPTVH